MHCSSAPALCWRFCLVYVRKHVPKVQGLFHPRISEVLQRLIKESSCLCVRQGREAPFWVCRNRSRVECNYLALHFTRRLAKPWRGLQGLWLAVLLLKHKAFSPSVFRIHLNFWKVCIALFSSYSFTSLCLNYMLKSQSFCLANSRWGWGALYCVG